jgi:hypothetical protein
MVDIASALMLGEETKPSRKQLTQQALILLLQALLGSEDEREEAGPDRLGTDEIRVVPRFSPRP